MARLEKADRITRIEKGVYCKKIKTAFGYYTPNKETLFCRQLLYDEDDVIGYETGLSVLNRLGLVSQIPKRKCIATNLYTKRVPAGMQVEIKKTFCKCKPLQLPLSSDSGCDKRSEPCPGGCRKTRRTVKRNSKNIRA